MLGLCGLLCPAALKITPFFITMLRAHSLNFGMWIIDYESYRVANGTEQLIESLWSLASDPRNEIFATILETRADLGIGKCKITFFYATFSDHSTSRLVQGS